MSSSETLTVGQSPHAANAYGEPRGHVGTILDKLDAAHRSGRGWIARCPAHDDHTPSLSIKEDNRTILLRCHAGCDVKAICAALQISPKDLFAKSGNGAGRIVAEYNYVDEQSKLLYQKVRYEPKTFKNRRPDDGGGWIWNLEGVRRVPYSLPRILAANFVLVCEGEKDCDTAAKLGLDATNSRDWAAEFSDFLRNKQVAIIADADESGRKIANGVAEKLAGKVTSLKLVELPGSKDLSDWVAAGGNREALEGFIGNEGEWKPNHASDAAQTDPISVKKPQAASGSAVITCMADIPRTEIVWLWDKRFPLGKLSVMAGDPGLGKSALTLDFAARVSLGRNWPNGDPCKQGSVIILSAEDDPSDTLRPRLEAAGADLSKIHVLKAVRVSQPGGDTTLKYFSLATDLHTLQEAVSSLDDVRLIIIDPISAYLGTAIDARKNAEVRSILHPLADLAATSHACVLCLTHLNKGTGPALYRIMDSVAFTAAGRTAWLVTKNRENPSERMLLPGKSNLGTDDASVGFTFTLKEKGGAVAIEWGGATNVTADSMVENEFESRGDRSAREEAGYWLRTQLADGSQPVTAIQAQAKADGFSWATVRRAKDSLPIRPFKISVSGGWAWELRSERSS